MGAWLWIVEEESEIVSESDGNIAMLTVNTFTGFLLPHPNFAPLSPGQYYLCQGKQLAQNYLVKKRLIMYQIKKYTKGQNSTTLFISIRQFVF